MCNRVSCSHLWGPVGHCGSIQMLHLHWHWNCATNSNITEQMGGHSTKNAVWYLAFCGIHSSLVTQVPRGHKSVTQQEILVSTAPSLILQCRQNVGCVTSDYSHHFPSNRLISSIHYRVYLREQGMLEGKKTDDLAGLFCLELFSSGKRINSRHKHDILTRLEVLTPMLQNNNQDLATASTVVLGNLPPPLREKQSQKKKKRGKHSSK